ncbi:MAG TPA: AAA family ATPase, partial [Candidatus Limnocylindria bacterium]|nr:AAA family ATPase [Candidatus Limnocylindria bacterium]
RTGVNTGEVVAGDAATGQSLATGDVVNTAARLEQAAGAGEVLIGPLTYRLVRHAVTAEQASPLELKGKAERVAPWRVRAVNLAVGAQARHMDSPMVGRDRQLRLLTDAAERARDDRAPQLVTVLGLAGVGKSRLVHEFLGRIREAATVIRGRCLSYGDAISYWPLAEAFRGAAGIEPGDPPEKAIERLTALAGGVAQSQVVAERVAAAIGLASADAVATGGQETFWAVRRLLEAMARRQPLVAVFDDMQWGTPTFLDLIEHITDWSRDAPILLLAIARPELLEARPTWGGGKMNAATLFLEPLDEASVSEMLLHLTGSALPEELARRIAQAAEGNPLFVEELLSMLVDDRILEREGDAYRVTRMPEEIAVPPTIELLLAARLDHLPSEERAVLGRAAVVGKSFGASEVAELSPDPERTSVLPRLMALVRKELVRLDEAPARDDEILGEKVRFRFRHQLVRDAAYESLPKQERARLHEAYAGWLETALEPRTSELHEVIGHHLEQAHRYRRAVGGDEAATQVLARRAAGHLASAARRATAIGDRTAVIRLLEGLGALLPDDDVDRLATRPQLAAALVETGRLGEAQRAIDEVLDAPSAPPATRAEALEQVGVAEQQGRSAVEMRPAVEEALRIRRELGDPRGIASALDAASRIEFFVGRLTRVQALAEEGIRYAREAGDADLEARLRQTQLVALLMSPEGGGKALPMLREACEFARANGLRAMEGLLQAATGFQTAVSGSRAEGEELMRQGLAIILDLGMRVGAPTNLPAQVAYFAGDIRAAIEELRTTYDELTAVGEKGYLSTHAAELAHWHLDLDEVDAADEYCRVAAESGAHDDVVTQVEVI